MQIVDMEKTKRGQKPQCFLVSLGLFCVCVFACSMKRVPPSISAALQQQTVFKVDMQLWPDLTVGLTSSQVSLDSGSQLSFHYISSFVSHDALQHATHGV